MDEEGFKGWNKIFGRLVLRESRIAAGTGTGNPHLSLWAVEEFGRCSHQWRTTWQVCWLAAISNKVMMIKAKITDTDGSLKVTIL